MLTIALTKAALVILFFMGVRWSSRLTWVVAASGFVWLLILFGITMSDYLSRGWMVGSAALVGSGGSQAQRFRVCNSLSLSLNRLPTGQPFTARSPPLTALR